MQTGFIRNVNPCTETVISFGISVDRLPLYLKWTSAILLAFLVAGCGKKKIDGYCFNSADAWAEFLTYYEYTEIKETSIKNGRTVALYKSSSPPQDYMIGVHDPKQERWCVQFTQSDIDRVVDWLLQHYDPAIVGK